MAATVIYKYLMNKHGYFQKTYKKQYNGKEEKSIQKKMLEMNEVKSE